MGLFGEIVYLATSPVYDTPLKLFTCSGNEANYRNDQQSISCCCSLDRCFLGLNKFKPHMVGPLVV